MKKQPTVSVCIPAYNHEKYVADCLESVLKQTFTDFEIVITDDGSTDRTVEIIESFADTRIRLFRSGRNRGPSATANNNFREARGEYICVLASDDMFHPEKIEQQVAYLEANPGVGAVFSHLRYVDESGVMLPDHPGYEYTDADNRSRENWLRTFFFKGNCLAAPTAMMRREVLERVGMLDLRLLQTQDFDLWIRICLHYELYVLQDRLVDYRILNKKRNTSANTPEKQSQTYWELSKVLNRYCEIEDETFLYKIFPEARALEPRLSMKAKIALIGLQGEARFTQVFAVELLYRLMADVKFAHALEASGCDFPEFYRLVGKVDTLGMAAETRAFERIQGLKAEYDWAAGQIDRWKKECERQTERTRYWKDKCGVKEERAQHWKTQYKHMAEEATLRFQIRKRLSALWPLR